MPIQFRAFVAAALLIAPAAFAQSTTKLNASASGTNGNGFSTVGDSPDTLSEDGRFAVFASASSNLVPGDTNSGSDVFLRDTVAGTIVRVSLASNGSEAGGGCSSPAVSNDGRWIAFESIANDLVVGDLNQNLDIFVHDRQTGLTSIVSIADSGTIGNNSSFAPSISGDGTLIAFASDATNLVPSDTNGFTDVFVRDLVLNTTRLVSRVPGGALGNGDSESPAVSANGQFVAFFSGATNLAPGATSAFSKIFVVDLASGGPQLVSKNSLGVAADNWVYSPSISADGSRIAFTSGATNLATVSQTVSNAFLHDRTTGTTTLINALPNGTPANGTASNVRLSNNGAFALLLTSSSNLTPGHSGTTPDAIVIELSTRLALRASMPLVVPGEPNSASFFDIGGVSDNGRLSTFSGLATNLVAGDPDDSICDVYLRDSLSTWYRDADGDTWGNSANSLSAVFPPTVGYVLVPGDCDDSNPAAYPGAIETCNGVDDDCDGTIDELAWSSYCTAGTSVASCTPTVSATGFPSASNASGFFVQASGLPSGKQAIAIYGLAPTATIYAFNSTSTICVASPRARTVNLPTGGTAGPCMGSYSLDWLAWMALHPTALGNPLTSGQTIYAQVWYRDSGAPLNANLTDAIRFDVCP